MTKLDEARPYGTIRGTYENEPTARFSQGGKFFDAQKDLIDGGLRQNSEEQSQATEQIERDGYDDPGGQGNETTGQEEGDVHAGQDEAGHVLETSADGPVMDKTDEELAQLASSGIGALRKFADKFGVKGTSKKEIVTELKALRK